VICLAFATGKRHDFRLLKESGVRVLPKTTITADTGYQGIAKLHANSLSPRKRSKRHPLSKEDKQFNHFVSSQRMANEHVIGRLKRFRILSERYRNRRKRFALRFSLIAGICNYDFLS
jgi:hypothetical protein